MKFHNILTISLFFCICAAGGCTADGSIPLMPAEFYGTVYIDNNPAPVGTTVTALLNGIPIDEIVIAELGVFGGSGIFDKRLSVIVEDAGTGPYIIQFQVNGIPIEGEEEFAPGTSKKVDLVTASTNTVENTPVPTEPSTPIPTPTITATIVTLVQTQVPVQTVPTAPFIPYDPYYPSQPQEHTGSVDSQYERIFISGDERAQLICYPGSEIKTAAGSTVQQATIKHKSLTGIQTPDGLAYAEYGYELVPVGLSFLPDATLSISIDNELFDANPMIMRYEAATDSWTYMPSLADQVTGTVRAAVTESGIYGVVIQDMTPAAEVRETQVPESQTPVPTEQIQTPPSTETTIPTPPATLTPTQTKASAPLEPAPPVSPQSKAIWYIAGGIVLIIIVNIIVWGVYTYARRKQTKQEEL